MEQPLGRSAALLSFLAKETSLACAVRSHSPYLEGGHCIFYHYYYYYYYYYYAPGWEQSSPRAALLQMTPGRLLQIIPVNVNALK